MGLVLRLLIVLGLVFSSSVSFADSSLRSGLGTPPPYIRTTDNSTKGAFTKLIVENGSLVINGTHAHYTASAGSITSGQFLKFDGTNSSSATGAFDFGGATSFEIPNTAGNVTVDAAGEVAVDSTNRQLVWYDGTREIAIPAVSIAQGSLDLASEWDIDPDVWLDDLDTTRFPNGVYLTAVYVDCNVADPTTELAGDLKYCDAVAGGAFPGANATLIVAIDTTTGNFSNAAVNTTIPAGKSIYITLDSDPTDSLTLYHIKLVGTIEED